MDFDRFSVALLALRLDAPRPAESEAAALHNAHMSYLADLHQAGHLLVAGPLADDSLRGLVRGSCGQIWRVLEMRGECERCQTILGDDAHAMICSYECTFCAPCASHMDGICPNCAGELVARPRRKA